MLGIARPADGPREGRDLSPLLRGEQRSWSDAIFAQYTPDQVGNIEFLRMIRTGKWKLVRAYLNPAINQLFDLEKDPEELRNLYYRDVLAPNDSAVPGLRLIRDSLDRRLLQWQRSIDDPALTLEKDFLEARRKARARWERRP
jgi:arylsulfatase A-like enzyme